MWLQHIHIRNFRNYESESLQLADGLTMLNGPNGAGKTNFLEAIGLLSHGKSLRLRNTEDLIRDGFDTALLTGVFCNRRGSTVSVRCSLERGKGKRVRINGKAAARISDIFRLVPTVQCFENDTSLLNGAPSVRRSFLDCLCAQLYPDYLQRHREYRDILKQRNAALRAKQFDGPLRRATDTVFTQKAAPVMILRQRALRAFANMLSAHRADVTEEMELAISERHLTEELSAEETARNLLERLQRSKNEEQRYCRTSVGPHRDSFSFHIAGNQIRWRASRGQVKNMVLRIKIAEYHLLRHELGRTPIVILDDVFAEMDGKRRSNLQKVLELGAQTFWASTGVTSVDVGNGQSFLRLEINDGTIRERQEVLAAA